MAWASQPVYIDLDLFIQTVDIPAVSFISIRFISDNKIINKRVKGPKTPLVIVAGAGP